MQFHKIFTIYLFLACFSPLWAEKESYGTYMELGGAYYKDQEFSRAAPLFLKAYQQKDDHESLEFYVRSLIKSRSFSSLKSFLKKEQKRKKTDNFMHFLYGLTYYGEGNVKKGEAHFQTLIDNTPLNKTDIEQLAKKFIDDKEYSWAEKTYIKGQKVIKKVQFMQNIAMLAFYNRDYSKYIHIYLDYLHNHPQDIAQVQNQLLTVLNYDVQEEFSSYMKESLSERTKKYPQMDVYPRMMIWTLLIKKQYSEVLRYSMLLSEQHNKYYKELLSHAAEGYRLGLRQEALAAYRLVASHAKSPHEQQHAKIKLFEVQLDFVKQKYLPETADSLYNELLNFIQKELNFNPTIPDPILYLTWLKGFYRNEIDSAITMLKQANAYPTLPSSIKGKYFYQQAKLYLLRQDFYLANLYFARVDRTNVPKDLKEQAKYQKAMTSLFSGDIKWAQSQFDILKGGTSNWVANDAIDISLLLNRAIIQKDTTGIRSYALARLLLYQRKYYDILSRFDSLQGTAHSFADALLWLKAQTQNQLGQWNNAVETLSVLQKNFPKSLFVDDALYLQAILWQEKFKRYSEAKANFKQLSLNFPLSVFAPQARERYQQLEAIPPRRRKIP